MAANRIRSDTSHRSSATRDSLLFKQARARERGLLDGPRDHRVSARIEGALFDAAKAASGIDNDSELIRAALAAIAVPDNFGEWLLAQQGRLDEDFGLAG